MDYTLDYKIFQTLKPHKIKKIQTLKQAFFEKIQTFKQTPAQNITR